MTNTPTEVCAMTNVTDVGLRARVREQIRATVYSYLVEHRHLEYVVEEIMLEVDRVGFAFRADLRACVEARTEQQKHIEELEHEILTFKMVVPHCHAFLFSSGNTSDTLPPLDATCVCGITYAAAIRAQGGER